MEGGPHLSANQRPVSRSCDHSGPISGREGGPHLSSQSMLIRFQILNIYDDRSHAMTSITVIPCTNSVITKWRGSHNENLITRENAISALMCGPRPWNRD